MALATCERSGQRYQAGDIAFVQELADRAALALDNARLYGEAELEVQRRWATEDALCSRYEQLWLLYDVAEAVGAGRRRWTKSTAPRWTRCAERCMCTAPPSSSSTTRG